MGWNWILIVYIFQQPGLAHIEFNSKEKCEVAGQAIKKEFHYSDKDGVPEEDHSFYYCVEK